MSVRNFWRCHLWGFESVAIVVRCVKPLNDKEKQMEDFDAVRFGLQDF